METTKTLFRIDFYNGKNHQTETKYIPAGHFSDAYHTAKLLMHTHGEFERIKQITELYPIIIVTQAADNEHTDK